MVNLYYFRERIQLGVKMTKYKARYSGKIGLHYKEIIESALKECLLKPNDLQITLDRKGALRVTFKKI